MGTVLSRTDACVKLSNNCDLPVYCKESEQTSFQLQISIPADEAYIRTAAMKFGNPYLLSGCAANLKTCDDCSFF